MAPKWVIHIHSHYLNVIIKLICIFALTEFSNKAFTDHSKRSEQIMGTLKHIECKYCQIRFQCSFLAIQGNSLF